MKTICFSVVLSCMVILAQAQPIASNLVIGPGQMPNATKDKNGTIHMVYGKGDSILYVSSKDGRSFTTPSLIAVLPQLYSFATRGPQIAATINGLVVTACTQEGNIYAFYKGATRIWTKSQRVNDNPETAKEGLMALSADGLNVYAVWLNVKTSKGQTVQGARSKDGGLTWSKNLIVYDSPDGTVCECCKPSVIVHGNQVYVQFRNWISGNRDLYLAVSSDGGKSFRTAQKLGVGSWRLNGCPMDGGGLVLNKGVPLTVWRREAKIFAAVPGQQEKEIGEGRSPYVEVLGDRQVYTWTQNGEVVVVTQGGKTWVLGKGTQPQLKALNDNEVLCVWEGEKRIQASVVAL
jgi:hypothetical protein